LLYLQKQNCISFFFPTGRDSPATFFSSLHHPSVAGLGIFIVSPDSHSRCNTAGIITTVGHIDNHFLKIFLEGDKLGNIGSSDLH
jgi:hypothetical protein